MNLVPALTGVAQHRPDAINLQSYPALAYAPLQHGDFVAFARNGKPVGVLASSPAVVGAADAIADAADLHGVSFADVCDALKFLRDQGQI